MVRVGCAARGGAHEAVRTVAACALTAFALVACEPGASRNGPNETPPLVRFATAGGPCDSTATVYIDSEDGAPLFCGDDRDNYTGPLLPSEMDEATLGTPGFQVHWVSDADRDRWERAVEAAFERTAAPRLAKRQACAGDIGEVDLAVSRGPDPEARDIATVTLAPAPGAITLTWEIAWLYDDVVVEGGLTERELRTVALNVQNEGSASTSFRFLLRDGGRHGWNQVHVWVNAESGCGAVDSKDLLAFRGPSP